MIKGERIRFDIHNILYSIYRFNKTLKSTSIKRIMDICFAIGSNFISTL